MFEEIKAEVGRLRSVDVAKIGEACDAHVRSRGEHVMKIGKALTAAGF